MIYICIGIVQLDFERINGDSTNQKTWDFMGKMGTDQTRAPRLLKWELLLEYHWNIIGILST